jgi:hypothetical protein
MGSEETSGGGDKWKVRMCDDGEHKVIEDGHAVGSRTFLEVGLIFMQRYIAWVMQVILDMPVGTQHVQELGWRSLVGRQAGDAIDHLVSYFSSFRNSSSAFQLEDLL